MKMIYTNLIKYEFPITYVIVKIHKLSHIS